MKEGSGESVIIYRCGGFPPPYGYKITFYEDGAGSKEILGGESKKVKIPLEELDSLATALLNVDITPEFINLGVVLDGWSDSLTVRYKRETREITRSNEELNKQYEGLIRRIKSYFRQVPLKS